MTENRLWTIGHSPKPRVKSKRHVLKFQLAYIPTCRRLKNFATTAGGVVVTKALTAPVARCQTKTRGRRQRQTTTGNNLERSRCRLLAFGGQQAARRIPHPRPLTTPATLPHSPARQPPRLTTDRVGTEHYATLIYLSADSRRLLYYRPDMAIWHSRRKKTGWLDPNFIAFTEERLTEKFISRLGLCKMLQ